LLPVNENVFCCVCPYSIYVPENVVELVTFVFVGFVLVAPDVHVTLNFFINVAVKVAEPPL
jgi:hypothetical protein